MRRKTKTSKFNAVLLIVYLLIVWTAYAYLYAHQRPAVVFPALAAIAVLAVFLPRLLDLIGRISLPGHGTGSFQKKTDVFLIAFLATMAVLFIWRLSCWPGGFYPDSAWQLQQAMAGQYDDWHPTWHTLVFFTMPYKLTGSVYSIFFFQDLVFCAAMAYMLTMVCSFGGRLFAVLSWCYIMLDPFVCYIVMYPLKDTPFALACMVAAVLSVQMWCTRGEAGISWNRCAALGAVLACAAIFRHNGILFAGPLLLALAFTMKKNWWKTVLVFVLVFAAVRGPLYRTLHVQKPGKRVTEITCVPMGVMGNVVRETPERLDAETREFMYAVAEKEIWETTYERGNYNSVKWYLANAQPVEEAGVKNILQMAWRAANASPRAAVTGFIDLTDMVYGLHSSTVPQELPYFARRTEGETAGMTQQGSAKVGSVILAYEGMCGRTPVRYLFTIGASMVIMLAFMLGRCDRKRREDRQRILIALSIFCYNFGTMLMVGGPDYRFFLASFMVCPVYVLLMLYDQAPETGAETAQGGRGEDSK